MPITEYKKIPRSQDLMLPTIQALKALGGSARTDEILAKEASDYGPTEAQPAPRRGLGAYMSPIDYWLAWDRTALKNLGAVENPPMESGS